MKTIEKTLLVLLIVFSTSLTYASINETAKLQLRENQDGIVQLLYTSTDAEKVIITIRNDNDKVVMSESVSNTNGFLRNYDFSELEVGVYTFEVSDKKGQIKKEVNFIKRSPVALVDQGENRYKLIYGSKKKTAVLVLLLDENGNTVQEDRFTSTDGFMKTYIVDKNITSAQTLRLVTNLETREFEL
ncbi:MAG: MSCRAMM family adhesin SdrC [bacterium]|nr:MSCRAMM family adhesin SdrC [bacterium]